MKKLVVATLILSGLAFSAISHAEKNTISIGYAQSKVQDFKNINGVNVKYRYEWDSPISVIGSFTYMTGKGGIDYMATRDMIKNETKVKYYSFSVGPAYRINQYVSVYGLLGINYNKIDYRTHWYNYEGNRDYVYMGKETGNQKKSALMYGAGVQINPTDYLAFDIGYEGSRLDVSGRDYSINGFNIGVGYSF